MMIMAIDEDDGQLGCWLMKKVVIEMMMMMVILPKTHHKTVHRK